MRSLCLALLAGCALYTGKPGNPDAQPCGTGVATEQVPAIELVDPDTLQCESFGGGGIPCDPTCGPCPAAKTPVEPIPTWGSCFSQCNSLDQATCEATQGCRVALDWDSYYSNGTSYLGCFATDMVMKQAECPGLGAEDCSRSDHCTALYQQGSGSGAGPQHFQECIPEGQQAGTCTGTSTCTSTVMCPPGTHPGIENRCFTGSCIPDQFCPQI